MKLAKRAGMSKAKVALARKLGIILHRMWVDGNNTPTEPALPSLRRHNRRTETQAFGRVATPAFPKRSPLAGTMEEVRPYTPT